MPGIGKLLVGMGALLIVVGGLFWLAERFSGRSDGFLPGDIVIRRGDFTFAFPIVTSIFVSIALSILLTLFFRFFGGGAR